MRLFFVSGVFLVLVSCQAKPYAPPPRPVLVEGVEVEVSQFEGRPEVQAVVRGRLSTTAAQLIDAKQARDGRILTLEVLEQTPRGAGLLGNLGESPPFETRIPVEILGLEPGPVTLYANGVGATFEIPFPRAEPAVTGEIPGSVGPVTLVDEFVPIEDTEPIGGTLRGVRVGGTARRPVPASPTESGIPADF